MPLITTALANLLIIVAIGIAVGLAFNRYGRSWWARHIGGRDLRTCRGGRVVHRISSRRGARPPAVTAHAVPRGRCRCGGRAVGLAGTVMVFCGVRFGKGVSSFRGYRHDRVAFTVMV